MGRPKLEIDEEKVFRLAKLGASNVDIGYVVGCSEAVIRARFHEVVAKGRATRRNSLRKWQWDAARNGNVAMLIWLGKQVLGQADRIESKNDIRTEVAGDQQRAMLGNERAMQLACDLDAELGRPALDPPPGDDPGGVRPPGE